MTGKPDNNKPQGPLGGIGITIWVLIIYAIFFYNFISAFVASRGGP